MMEAVPSEIGQSGVNGGRARIAPPARRRERGEPMGRVVAKVKVQSFEDILAVKRDQLDKARVRTVELDALVDTGASYLCLPPPVIQELGLVGLEQRLVTTANGVVERWVCGGAYVTIGGRTEQMSVMENDDKTPPLIGYLVLEALDFVIEPKSQQLIPNPAHDGKWVADLY